MSGRGGDRSRQHQQNPNRHHQSGQPQNYYGNGGSGGWGGSNDRHNDTDTNYRHNNNYNNWDRQRQRPENREYRSNNFTNHNTLYAPTSSISNSKRSNERNAKPDIVRSEPYPYRDRKSGVDVDVVNPNKKKRRIHDSGSISNNECTKSKNGGVVKVDEPTDDGNTGESAVASPTTISKRNELFSPPKVVKTEEHSTNAIVKAKSSHTTTTTTTTTTALMIKTEDRAPNTNILTTTTNAIEEEPYDSEANKQRWKTNLFDCYRFPDAQYHLPAEAYIPDTKELIEQKQDAAVYAVDQVMTRMRKDAEFKMHKDDDDDDDDDSSNSDDSIYSMSRGRCALADNFPYSKQHIQLFFAAIVQCTPLTIGFDVSGLRPRDADNCNCPCDKNISGWREKYKIEGTVAGRNSPHKNLCSKGPLCPMGLMSHVRKEGESCVLHYGIMHYMEHFYRKNHGSYRGGIGHKAMYQMNDTNWKHADAAEKKTLHTEILAGRKQLADEKARRLELERDRDEKTNQLEVLKHTNKDQFDRLQKLEEDRTQLSVVKKEEVPELDSATVLRYKKAFNAFFNTAKKALRSLESKKEKINKEETKLVIEVGSLVNLQHFFDEWYDEALNSNSPRHKKSASLLFHGLDSAKHGRNFYGRRIVNKWDLRFENEADKGGAEDKAIDQGGPTREFLSQCWKQMDRLRVWKDTGDKSDRLMKKGISIFEFKGNKEVPLEDDALRDRLKLAFPDETEYSEALVLAKSCHQNRRKKEGVKLFATQDNGVVPIEDDVLRYQLKVAFPDGTERAEALNRAKSYYRAIGRIILHSLANGHTISASAMPPFYQNWLLRGCSPKDDDYHNDDVLKHLSESGTTKNAIHNFVGLEWEFVDGVKEEITKESVFTKLIPNQYIDSRKDAFKAIKEGLTLDGDYSLSEFLRSFPLEAAQKVAFSSPHLEPKDVIAILKPKYCADWKDEECGPEKIAFQLKQETFFNDVLCEIISTKGNSSSKEYHPEFLSFFVKFCTGFDYLPDPDGNPDFKITIEFNFTEVEMGSHPMSHTCVNVLKLPGMLYENREAFWEKLKESVMVYGKKFTMQ